MRPKTRQLSVLAAILTLGLATVALATTIVVPGTGTPSFDSRSFSYSGHIAKSIVEHPPCSGEYILALDSHSDMDCGASACSAGEDNFLTACQITSGSDTYQHTFFAELLQNNETIDSKEVFCNHQSQSVVNRVETFPGSNTYSTTFNTYKWKLTIRNSVGAGQGSVDATLN